MIRSKQWTQIVCVLLVGLLTVGTFGCANKARTGAATGSAAGAILGELIDDDGPEGLLIGAVTGGLIGYAVGNEMDKADRNKFETTLNETPDGEARSWTSDDGTRYTVKPTQTYTENNRACRNFKMTLNEQNDSSKTETGKACQTDEGWKMMKSG